jgi:hypothetical protein
MQQVIETIKNEVHISASKSLTIVCERKEIAHDIQDSSVGVWG